MGIKMKKFLLKQRSVLKMFPFLALPALLTQCTLSSPRAQVETTKGEPHGLLNTNSPSVENLTPQVLEKQWNDGILYKHLRISLAQWWDFYERPGKKPVAEQLQLLTPDIKILSIRGEVKGIENFEKSAQTFISTNEAQHAHHFQDLKIFTSEGEEVTAQAHILNQTKSKEGVVTTIPLRYEIIAQRAKDKILFKSLQILQESSPSSLANEFGEIIGEHFKDAVLRNRTGELLSRWMLGFEVDNADGVRSILSEFSALVTKDRYQVIFPSSKQPIESESQFKEWFQQSAAKIKKSNHDLVPFHLK